MAVLWYCPTPTTTAHCSRAGLRAAGAGSTGATGGGRSKSTVRTSCRTVPSGSLARTTMVLVPSRSFTGAATATDFFGGRSACLKTSVPFKSTLTEATPLHDAVEEHRAHLLLRGAVGVGGRDHDGVLPIPELEGRFTGKVRATAFSSSR